MSSDRNRRAAFMLASRLVLVTCLLAAAGCGSKRASRGAPGVASSASGAPAALSPQAGGYERGGRFGNRSCDQLTGDAEDLVDKMGRIASRRKKALLFVPKTVLSVFKRATGRSESAEELARQYEQRRAMVIAINAALETRGCPTVALPSDPEADASTSAPVSASDSGQGPVSGSTRPGPRY